MALAAHSTILQHKTAIPTALKHSKFPFKTINFQLKTPQYSVARYKVGVAVPPLFCMAESTFVSDNVQFSTASSTWSEFASNVSGEWDGFGADFTSEGNPIELPESVVPEAYREWEVKVFDWQTQCPTLAIPEHFSVTYKTIKLLPTVGCEADAATRYNIDERYIGDGDTNVSAFAFESNGCYVALWPIQNHGIGEHFELEHCLINPQDKESRMRIVLQLVHVANTELRIKGIQVFCEQWYGPFRNGDQLGGCAIRDSAFASTPATKASEVVGIWQGSTAAARFDTSQSPVMHELKGDTPRKSVRDEQSLILLPKQLWCSIKEGNNGETISEVGWLVECGFAVTSTCVFSSDAKLREATIARETAMSQDD